MSARPMFDITDDEVRALEAPGFFVRDGALGAKRARAVHEEAQRIAHTEALRAAGISREGKRASAVRNDLITWLDRSNASASLAPLLNLFDALRESLNTSAYLGLGRYDLQLALYPGGGARYVRHRDAFRGATTAPSANRRVTAIYYANPAWRPEHGGALRLFLDDGSTCEMEPILDRLVVFLSDRLEHEVLPVHAERLALTAWFYGR